MTLAFTKHCKKQYGIDLFVASPAKPGQKKVKKPRVFQLFGFIFWVCNVFFSTRWCGVARKRFFVILDPFLDSFSDFFQARNTGFYSIFVFCRSFTAIFKTAKTIVNTSVLCRPVAKNFANTTVFGRWVKKRCKLRCFWPPDLQKHRYLQWFLPPRVQKPCKKRHFCRFFHVFVFVVVVVVVVVVIVIVIVVVVAVVVVVVVVVAVVLAALA